MALFCFVLFCIKTARRVSSTVVIATLVTTLYLHIIFVNSGYHVANNESWVLSWRFAIPYNLSRLTSKYVKCIKAKIPFRLRLFRINLNLSDPIHAKIDEVHSSLLPISLIFVVFIWNWLNLPIFVMSRNSQLLMIFTGLIFFSYGKQYPFPQGKLVLIIN